MKLWPIRTRLYAALCLACTVCNSYAEPVAKTTFPDVIADVARNDIFQAYGAIFSELTPLLEAADPNRLLALNTFRFSKPTRGKLTKVFGNDHPLHAKTTRKKNGDAEAVFSIDPGHDSEQDFSELTGKLEFGGKVRSKSLSMELPYIRSNERLDTKGEFSGLRYAEHTRKGSLGLWLGTGSFSLEKFSLQDSRSNMDVGLSGAVLRSEMTQRGNRVDVDLDSVIDSVHWGSDGLGRIHLAARVTDLDGKALAAYVASQQRLSASQLTESARAAVMHKTSDSMLQAMFKQGLATDIQDLSIQYHGMTASMDGRIAWPPGLDISATDQMMKQADLRLNVRIPMALVDAFFHGIVSSQLRAGAKPDQEITPEQLNKAAKEQTAAILSGGLNMGLMRVENDTLISTVEYKASQLFLNGHAVPLAKARQ